MVISCTSRGKQSIVFVIMALKVTIVRFLIFFAFLSDKSLVLLGAPDDDFVDVLYSGYKVTPTGDLDYEITNEPFINYLKLSDAEKRYIAVTGTFLFL